MNEQEQATYYALWRGIVLVMVPGLLFVIGLIAFVRPPLPPVSTVYGCYRLNSIPLIRVSPGLISVDDASITPTKMSVDPGKEGYVIKVVPGFSFRTDQRGTAHAFRDELYKLGLLIPVYISRDSSPALGFISDEQPVKIPKVACPRA